MRHTIVAILAAAAAFASTGCALFEGTLTADSAVRSRQKYQKLPDEAWGVAQLAEITETTEELNPDGTVARRHTTVRKEYGVPVALAQSEMQASDTFVESDLTYSTHSSADGQKVALSKTTDVNETSYGAGARAQVQRTDITADFALGALNAAANAVTQINLQNRQAEMHETSVAAQKEIELAKLAPAEEPHAEPEHVAAPANNTGGGVVP